MHVSCEEDHGGVPAAKISDVLKAMHVPVDYALGTLRLSFGRHTTEQEIDSAAATIIAAVKNAWAV